MADMAAVRIIKFMIPDAPGMFRISITFTNGLTSIPAVFQGTIISMMPIVST
ncbi:hypothetical protein SRABI80_01626 [Peribacillus frigoritolerans]|nr:hypothetical protein SRABI80_01626 [Peribacillus frigoritolerans]